MEFNAQRLTCLQRKVSPSGTLTTSKTVATVTAPTVVNPSCLPNWQRSQKATQTLTSCKHCQAL